MPTTTKELIYEKLAAITSEVAAIDKEKKSGQGFKYRGIDDVMNALHTLFAKHGVTPMVNSEVLSREEKKSRNGGMLIFTLLKMKITFYATDGSSATATLIGEGMDSSDKGVNKATSAGYKYAMLTTFSIPTEEMTDPDQEGHDVEYQYAQGGPPMQQQQQQQQQPPQQTGTTPPPPVETPANEQERESLLAFVNAREIPGNVLSGIMQTVNGQGLTVEASAYIRKQCIDHGYPLKK